MGSIPGSMAVAEVAAAVGRLGEVDLDGLSDAALLELVRSLGPVVNAVQAQLTRVVGAVHARGAVRTDGFASTAAWLAARLHTADANRHVRAVRALALTPHVGAAYARGELSLAHVDQVAAVLDDIPPEALGAGVDALLAKQATEYTPGVFRRAAEHIRDHCDPDAADRHFRDHYGKRWLSVAQTYQGSVAIKGVLDPVAGELLINTLSALMGPPQPGDDRTAPQRRADALTDLCRLGAQHAPRAGGEKPHLIVTVDLATLQRRLAATTTAPQGTIDPASAETTHGARLTSGARIGAATARRLACDATIIPMVLGSAGEPLDIGRAARLVPAAIRRALLVRDGRCRYPGCAIRPQWTDAHHLYPWADGGPTRLQNLILLCRTHHSFVHEGGFAIRLDHDTGIVHACYPDGRALDLVSQPRSRMP